MSPGTELLGVVLCGGSSSRMGEPKAVMDLSGAPMAARVGGVLRAAGIGEVLAVGGDPRWRGALGPSVDDWEPDDRPGEGPLGGIATVVALRPGRPLVVAACDVPDLSSDLVRRVVAEVAAGRASVPVVGGRRQWSLVGLPADAATLAAERFCGGTRSLHAACAEAVDVPAVVGDGLEDLDTPGDVAAWREAHRGEG